MKSISEALAHVQKHIVAPKGQFNKFGKYHYRSVEDIVKAAKAVMPDGSALTLSDEIVFVEGRHYVRAEATFWFGGECIKCFGSAREADTKKGMDVSQITGASSSYARKYALAGLLGCDDGQDADALNKDADTRQEPRQEAPRSAKRNDLNLDEIVERVCGAFAKALKMQDSEDGKATAYELRQSVKDYCKGLEAEQQSQLWQKLDKEVKDWLKG